MMVAVTGVSGSGKSTLVHDVIYKSLDGTFEQGRQRRRGARVRRPRRKSDLPQSGQCRTIDASGAGGSIAHRPHSALEPRHVHQSVRPDSRAFRVDPEAQKRGYTAGHFSFNIPGGRCETCQGDGTVTVEMQFLADVELVCEECKGTRYKSSILDIRYNGLNIHEVLQLTVKEALPSSPSPRLVNKLKVLADVGLGYLRLGQSATTLSGGEAQRVKLAAHLARRAARARSSSSTSRPPVSTSTTSRNFWTLRPADPKRRKCAHHRT